MTIKLGYVIPTFSYGGQVRDLFPTVVAQAKEAEASGFDTVAFIDHLSQLSVWGPNDDPILEAYVTLGALASATSTIQLSTLVTGNTYRNPALLAKMATTLDVVSGGRAVLALGAGWFELEHEQFGFEYGTFTDRFERLAEALTIIDPMLRGKRPAQSGTWYSAKQPPNEPRIRDDVPIMLGGGGEKKTFALAAKHARYLNISASTAELPQKLAALEARCAEAGRDRATIETSVWRPVFLDEDGDVAREQQRQFYLRQGVDVQALPEAQQVEALDRTIAGSPDEVASAVQTKVLDQGIDGFFASLPATGHIPGSVELLGKALRPLFTRR